MFWNKCLIRTRRADSVLADLRVKTIGDLAAWKYAVWAEALVAAAEWEAADFRHK